jgi:hypothetical protein
MPMSLHASRGQCEKNVGAVRYGAAMHAAPQCLTHSHASAAITLRYTACTYQEPS